MVDLAERTQALVVAVVMVVVVGPGLPWVDLGAADDDGGIDRRNQLASLFMRSPCCHSCNLFSTAASSLVRQVPFLRHTIYASHRCLCLLAPSAFEGPVSRQPAPSRLGV